MLKMMRSKPTTLPPAIVNGGGGGESPVHEWEMRPGGMLVQKRTPDTDRPGAPPPTIRVRIKYGSVYHEIHISPQATFGELKKMLSGPTGLHHQDQKILYKDKERDSKAFLDITGVKDKSKMVVMEDPISQEKRLLELRKNAKSAKASKAISNISLEVDRLAGRVSALGMIINKGGKVVEKDLVKLIELFMNQVVKLEGIAAEGDEKQQQVRRIQKYVETLDVLKEKNSTPNGQQKQSNGQKLASIQEFSNASRRKGMVTNEAMESIMDMPIYQNITHKNEIQEQETYQPQPQPENSSSGHVMVTTKWELFD